MQFCVVEFIIAYIHLFIAFLLFFKFVYPSFASHFLLEIGLNYILCLFVLLIYSGLCFYLILLCFASQFRLNHVLNF